MLAFWTVCADCRRLMGRKGAGSAQLWEIVMDKVGLLRVARQPRQARPVALRALEVARRAFSPTDSRIALTLETLAEISMELRDYEDAQGRYIELFALFQEAQNEEACARIAATIGMVSRALGDSQQAITFYTEALELSERLHGTDFPELASMANNLALIYLENGNSAAAESFYLRALSSCRERAGEDPSDLALLLNNLGILYFNQERLDLSESMHAEALQLRQNMHPADPGAIVQSASNLAAVFHATGRLAEAESHYLSAINTVEHSGIGPTPDYLMALQNYALLLRSKGDNRKAQALEERSSRSGRQAAA